MGEVARGKSGVIAELAHLLAHLDTPTDHPDVMAIIARALDSETVANLRFTRHDDRAVVDRASSSGPGRLSRRTLDDLVRGVRAGSMQFLFSSPVPERAQRNRVIEVEAIRGAATLNDDQAHRYGLSGAALQVLRPKLRRLIALYDREGINDFRQLRVLICDGPALMRYLSSSQPQPFSPRQRQRFAEIVPLLRRRTLLEHRLAIGTSDRAALEVSLEAFGRAAFVVDQGGGIVHANALGLAALDRTRSLHSELGRAIGEPSATFEVHRIAEPAVPMRYLVIRRHAELAELASLLAEQLGLGGTAGRVLRAAASGDSTKQISMRLGVADNTVEYHLTRVFRRLGVSSRAELQRLLVDRILTLARAPATTS